MPCSFHHYGPLNSRGAVRIYALLRQPTATASCCRACPLVVVGLSSSCRRVVVELPSSLPSDTHDLLRLDTLQQAPSQYTLEARAQPPWLLRTGRRQQGRGDSRCYGSSRSGSLQHGRQVLRGALYEEQHATGHRGDVRPKQGNWVRNRHSQWTQLNTSGSSPSPRSGHDVVVIGSKAYLFGGCGGEQVGCVMTACTFVGVCTLWFTVTLRTSPGPQTYSYTNVFP